MCDLGLLVLVIFLTIGGPYIFPDEQQVFFGKNENGLLEQTVFGDSDVRGWEVKTLITEQGRVVHPLSLYLTHTLSLSFTLSQVSLTFSSKLLLSFHFFYFLYNLGSVVISKHQSLSLSHLSFLIYLSPFLSLSLSLSPFPPSLFLTHTHTLTAAQDLPPLPTDEPQSLSILTKIKANRGASRRKQNNDDDDDNDNDNNDDNDGWRQKYKMERCIGSIRLGSVLV